MLTRFHEPAQCTAKNEKLMMTSNRITLAELKANPPQLTPDGRARLESMSQDEIDAAAAADPVNPERSDEEFAHAVRQAHEKTGL
jgi:hypothetical protein